MHHHNLFRMGGTHDMAYHPQPRLSMLALVQQASIKQLDALNHQWLPDSLQKRLPYTGFVSTGECWHSTCHVAGKQTHILKQTGQQLDQLLPALLQYCIPCYHSTAAHLVSPLCQARCFAASHVHVLLRGLSSSLAAGIWGCPTVATLAYVT